MSNNGQVQQHMELMLQMGTPRGDGFNPFAPRSHRWMMDVDQPDKIRGMGWVMWRTVDRDPDGKTGPPKKRRTWFAHDERVKKDKWLTDQHMAEDLGMKLREAIDLLNALAKEELIRVDEDGRISPRGDAPLPRRIKSKDEPTPNQDLFRTECFPQPLIVYFQSLNQKRREQYVRLYLGMSDPFSQHLKKLPPEDRTQHTMRYLEGAEYDEQVDADALAAARAAHVKEERMAAAGWVSTEARGRKPVSRELTIALEIRIKAEDYFVQKNGDDFVQNGNSNSYENENGSVQKPHPYKVFQSSQSLQRVSESGENVEIPASGQEEVAANPTPHSRTLNPSPPPAPPNLPVEDQNAAHANAVLETFEALIGRELPAKDPMRREIAELGSHLNLPQTTVCRFMKEKHLELNNRKFQLDSPGAFRDILKHDLPAWLHKQKAEVVERERKADAEFRGPAEPFDPATYPAKMAELKSMTAKKGTS